MVVNKDVQSIEDLPQPIVALGNQYPEGHVIEPHRHRRGQLISGATGVIVLTTAEGTWVMPPQRGMWIPSATTHRVRMVGAVSMQSLFVEPGAIAGLPDHCQVVSISPFLRSLMTEALHLPVDFESGSRTDAVMDLIRHELQQLSPLPLSLKFPSTGPLAERCRRFVEAPDIHETIEQWSAALGMSERTFTRHFRRETGLTFGAWRQQACLLSAMPRLAAGEPVTIVAADLGYENPAAFTLMFRRVFGSSPLTYLGLRKPR